MQRWLLLSNCQTFGLANSLMLANPTLEVTGVDLWTYQADAAGYNRAMADYDRVIVHPDIARLPAFDASRSPHLNHLPSLDFSAYHPDTGYFWVDGAFVSGPMVNYVSLLAVAAHELGLSRNDTRALYAGRTYEACGYLSGWTAERDAVVARFRDHGIDVSAQIRRWGRGRAFMYSVNHPRIEPLWDIACALLSALGIETFATDVMPSDNLVSGPCLPVYPEIAEALGVRGSDLFKVSGAYRYLGLDAVLDGTLAALDAYPRGAVRPHPTYQQRYDRVLAAVKGHA